MITNWIRKCAKCIKKYYLTKYYYYLHFLHWYLRRSNISFVKTILNTVVSKCIVLFPKSFYWTVNLSNTNTWSNSKKEYAFVINIFSVNKSQTQFYWNYMKRGQQKPFRLNRCRFPQSAELNVYFKTHIVWNIFNKH